MYTPARGAFWLHLETRTGKDLKFTDRHGLQILGEIIQRQKIANMKVGGFLQLRVPCIFAGMGLVEEGKLTSYKQGIYELCTVCFFFIFWNSRFPEFPPRDGIPLADNAYPMLIHLCFVRCLMRSDIGVWTRSLWLILRRM
jgi:hypothetical protein